MRSFRQALSALVCCAVLAGLSPAAAYASPQEPVTETPASLDRIKERLEKPPARPLRPKEAVHLRPRFRSRVTDRPFVPTLEEHLHKTFELTDFQRKYAEYAAKCCGYDLGALFRLVDQALDERKARKVREQVARELAGIEAARAAQVR